MRNCHSHECCLCMIFRESRTYLFFLIHHPSSVSRKGYLLWLLPSTTASLFLFSLPFLCLLPSSPSVAQTPCRLEAVRPASSLKACRNCGVMAIVCSHWSLTGHIVAQQDIKETKAVCCIVLRSKWRSPSSLRGLPWKRQHRDVLWERRKWGYG